MVRNINMIFIQLRKLLCYFNKHTMIPMSFGEEYNERYVRGWDQELVNGVV